MTGLALVLSEVPADVVARLAARVHDREGVKELQFHWKDLPTVLPVHWNGRLHVLRWGSKDRRGRLPYGGWVPLAAVEGGSLSHARPEEVTVPANLGYHAGVWFLVREGFRAVVLPHAPGGPVAYLLVEPATNYYRNMTEQSDTMPSLLNQVI